MKRFAIVLLMLASELLSSCTTPQQAADDVCGCLHETVRIWEKDGVIGAALKFTECSEMHEEYKKQFSGENLVVFEKAYDECLKETISSELLLLLLK